MSTTAWQWRVMINERRQHEDLLRSDDQARAEALDPEKSFIVRAPAGSGKTELLTQRVLALLATADAPEEIVAVTFTRKAAAEMKDRLLKALNQPADVPTEKSHHVLTAQLARRVMARDRELGWQLAANPARLRVQTIDALAQWLAHQLPVTMQLGGATAVTEHAEPLYDAAARATLALIDSSEQLDREPAQHVTRLLTHLDNDGARLHRLLSDMLAKRDHWLRRIKPLDRATLEAPLQQACSEQIARICRWLPPMYIDEMLSLASYAAGNVTIESRLSPCANLDGLPEVSHRRLDVWLGVAAMLLTNEGDWRTKFNKNDGFPPTLSARPYKRRITALTAAFRTNDELRDALHGLRELPAPHFTDAQWQVLESIVALLPRAAAELMLAFGDAGETDFVQVTRAAVNALADEDAASDLAHALDARIKHLLIDEFQDTSISQFELVQRLIADWRTGDGRTVFVVGDPMQSIYGFREAEVGLFLRAWNDGIANVSLRPLMLTRNFRSMQPLVSWVNDAFARVLPTGNDIAAGAVAFEPSIAADRSDVHASGSAAVLVHALLDQSLDAEAAQVVAIVSSIYATEPKASIALLVRQRAHFAHIAPALRAANLAFTAVELDALLARPLVNDLLALTRALEHLADRVAWLSVLRAPWCGLTLADLAALAEGEADATIWQLACDPIRRLRLSADGQLRLARCITVLTRALELRGRGPIAERVRDTWWLLGGPACIATVADHADASAFFSHLARSEDESRGAFDMDSFQTSLARLYAATDAGPNVLLQVMTIHKAKGLEFDHVIVPGLDRIPPPKQAQLMLWLDRPTEAGGEELLLSPIYAAEIARSDDSIYCWIARRQEERIAHEDERLLYVAATRARRQLHWLACVPTKNGELCPARKHSLLARLWPAVEPAFMRALNERLLLPAPISVNQQTFATATYDQSLRRLPSDWVAPLAPQSVAWNEIEPAPVHDVAIEFSWAGEGARRVGIVVHRWLQRIADDRLQNWDAVRVRAIAPHIERQLAGIGITGNDLKVAIGRVQQALISALGDAHARWLLGSHDEASNELRLSVATGVGIKHIAIDRTFVDAGGTRWIIDYKTGTHEGADAETFLDREQQRYKEQLDNYAAAFGGKVRLGLYFPLLPGWREWAREDES
ncbi:MAG: UvrD-helicase domain-containing protein [Burkholderiaceae bacterium]|nr:UvrD-helicase domain-containing protein [Burkholderiaceae bacterium]